MIRLHRFYSVVYEYRNQIILTKSDVCNSQDLQKSLKVSCDEIMTKQAGLPFIHVVSSKTGSGIEDLRLAMTEIMSHNWNANSTPPVLSGFDPASLEDLMKQNSIPEGVPTEGIQ